MSEKLPMTGFIEADDPRIEDATMLMVRAAAVGGRHCVICQKPKHHRRWAAYKFDIGRSAQPERAYSQAYVACPKCEPVVDKLLAQMVAK